MPIYFIVLLATLLVAFFIQHKYGLIVYHSKKEAFQVTLHFLVFGLLLDYYGIYHQYWTFLGNGILGLRIYGLPIEEFLLCIIAPYSLLVVYKFYTSKDK